MNSFLTKLAMLVMFLLAVSCAWAAVVMVFPVSLFNLLLGILAAFFLLRAFELADKINKLGPYAEDTHEDTPQKPDTRRQEPTQDPGDEVPDEE